MYMIKMSCFSGLLHLLDSKTTPMYCHETHKQRIGVIGALFRILRWLYGKYYMENHLMAKKGTSY